MNKERMKEMNEHKKERKLVGKRERKKTKEAN